MYDRVPEGLRSLRQWVCHRFPDKAPLCPFPDERGDLTFASCNKPETWGSFEAAVKAVSLGWAKGIGIEFANGIAGIDIDHCVDGGELSELAREIVETFRSYTEISPSGTGVHILFRGKLPGTGRKLPMLGLEVYDSGRYFTVTGNAYLDPDGDAYPLRDCTEELDAFYKRYFDDTPPEQTKLQTKSVSPADTQKRAASAQREAVRDLSDEEILEIAYKSRNGEAFRRLYDGTYSAAEVPQRKDGTPDQSSIDMRLANHLAFWYGADPDRVDRMFRRSALFRPKWDRSVGGGKTYGQRTVEIACRGHKDVFVPYDRPSDSLQPPMPDEPPPPPPGKSAAAASDLPAEEEDQVIPQNPTKYTHDDTGNAHRFRDANYKDLRYDHVDKVWYCWTGKRWQEDQTGEVKRRADELLDEMEGEAKRKPDDEAAPLLKLVRRTRSSKSKEAMIKEAQHLEGIPMLPNEFDRYKDALNVQNGVINLKTGRLRPHSRKLMLSMLADVDFNPDAKCPRWIHFLEDVTRGDQELQLYLQRTVGYCLTGSTIEQCVFFLFGNGKNGKSTFLDTISSIMGDYAKNSQAETVMQKDRGSRGASSDVARLKGARLVTTSEPNDGCRLDEGIVKQMTGGEKITARMLYKAEIEYRPEFKIMMGTNVRPKITGSDDGIWRRVKMIPFTAQIPANKIDRRLGDKLREEKSGILNWAIAGAIGWYNEGLPPCAAVDYANEEYRKDMDRMQQFVEDCLTRAPGNSLQAMVLYGVYRRWCEQNGERYPLSTTKFSMELQDHYGFRKQKNARFNEYMDVGFTEVGQQFCLLSPDSPCP
ncbi:phage/plasmid primase, P4 family [Anaerotruncus sp. DFI.9.16]|uniref:phage/plasmid primase, P4 family n=1 Tax=Anaerotruncus sp. DFI.9.16 TaxID=2965275 RepID=UPI002108EA0B|nr:phage/plasmid primase, P4 family [Anaerotruncus sp. DFI.9.16]